MECVTECDDIPASGQITASTLQKSRTVDPIIAIKLPSYVLMR
jgi:hypothetical protein